VETERAQAAMALALVAHAALVSTQLSPQ